MISESLLGVGHPGNTLEQNKTAGLKAVIMSMSSVLIIVASLIFGFHNKELKRTKFEQEAMKKNDDEKMINIKPNKEWKVDYI